MIELYDRARDPFELATSPAPAPGRARREVERAPRALTAELADCAGIEGRDPEPASGHYCR